MHKTESDKDDHRLIFIGGSPRSGTTLVQNMLDSHPLVLGGPEFLHLKDFIQLRQKLHSSIAREWIDIICNRKDVDNYLISWVKELFLALADKHQCEFYSEKTPENILVFSDLLELFPKAHFIQVLRDPRAILSSMQHVKQRAIGKGLKPPVFTKNTSNSLVYIKRCFDAGLKACRCAPEKVLTVVYEKLIADPEIEAKKICNHLGIGWDSRMLRPGEKEHLGIKAITTKSNEIWYDSESYNRNIVAQDSEKWRSELTLYQQLRATMAFGGNSELMRYGYELSIDGLADRHHGLKRTFIQSLAFGMLTYRKMISVIRKIPGFSFLKNRFLTVSRFFRI